MEIKLGSVNFMEFLRNLRKLYTIAADFDAFFDLWYS